VLNPTLVDARTITGTLTKFFVQKAIYDLRHGTATTVGSVRLAYVALIIDDLAPVELTLGGEFAAPDGEPFTVIVSESTTVDAGV
jgi:hypothetical protein